MGKIGHHGKAGRTGKPGIKPTEIPHLYRVHYSEADQIGYLVRLHRSRGHVEELFSFSDYPTRRACFRAAEKRAREVEQLYPRLTRMEYAQIHRSNFKNGEVGVRKVTKTVKNSPYDFWEASWSPSVGVVKKKRFSVHKYGDEEAHKLAREARADGLLSLSRREPKAHPRRAAKLAPPGKAARRPPTPAGRPGRKQPASGPHAD
jgi:hypothetical protein